MHDLSGVVRVVRGALRDIKPKQLPPSRKWTHAFDLLEHVTVTRPDAQEERAEVRGRCVVNGEAKYDLVTYSGTHWMYVEEWRMRR